MAESSPIAPASTFVVQLWHEWSAAGFRWRGWIEHVQSGKRAAFLEFDDMLDFIRRFAAMPSDLSQPAREDN
jgi:hypothetical protein